jgi:hypothetical protein
MAYRARVSRKRIPSKRRNLETFIEYIPRPRQLVIFKLAPPPTSLAQVLSFYRGADTWSRVERRLCPVRGTQPRTCARRNLKTRFSLAC